MNTKPVLWLLLSGFLLSSPVKAQGSNQPAASGDRKKAEQAYNRGVDKITLLDYAQAL